MSSPLNIKQNLYNACFQFIENRLLTVQRTINEIQESLTSETKSSAGDKHETGRAMLQLEREKAGNQLAEIVKVKEALSKISTEKNSKTIGLGSAVYTTKANYYIAISAGELTVNKDKFYAISPNTPIGQLLMGKEVNESIAFRGIAFVVKEVL
ncbi:3-oxoacyl-ACP synthase [Algibacter amylolyticus]|uniref:3-oxoacyl-ACP synthase n=1 Tax=Algibacter amylolyticus TaxID=1608400 RepID=A0A5M7BKF5_9FLAO|nr:3-oxoacyl-ACP synthase [Algibacter amylolyticus]KAA5827505.1 3-oxoacyl-ACP synthase [Algibacter amylolyticus]MBB5266706.1 transcription elongation GreA/GreB family factor [Algibacter amylolyticus]TSJ81750.1 3-oxoacyl-ACP synthase [Algibacter amylolyticus]